MSAQAFPVGTVIWAETASGGIVSGPVTEVSSTPMHYIMVDGREIVACPAFATEAEALQHRKRSLEIELAMLNSRLSRLEGGAS